MIRLSCRVYWESTDEIGGVGLIVFRMGKFYAMFVGANADRLM